jgi:molecular chaperone IbpA
MRTSFDFSPYRRSTIGFDRIFDLLETGLRGDAVDGFPPFDIVKDGEDRYSITLAVAGFTPDEIEIVAHENQLLVTGKKDEEMEEGRYLYRGIATRSFERRFQLADFIQVQGASFVNGLLKIDLKREVPEAMKPRRIEIEGMPPANDQIQGPEHGSNVA